jgi:hypothetical protein
VARSLSPILRDGALSLEEAKNSLSF